MSNYINKTLMLILLTLCLGIFSVTSSYAFTLSEAQKLLVSNGEAGDNFGFSVSLSGDTALIGAWGDDDNGRGSGSAYVFVRDSIGSWSKQQKLTASDGAAGDAFGWDVSISGDTALIGADGGDDNGRDSGSAYVFVRDGTGLWEEQQKLTPSVGAVAGLFGHSVSIDGGTAVIGAYQDDDNGSRSGSVTVFVRDGSGVWREQQKLTASDGAESDLFGWAVSIDGSTAVIGAIGSHDNGTSSGSVYVFIRNGTTWNEEQKLIASDGTEGDTFGYSVSITGDTAVIGGQDLPGSAYVFVRDGAGRWNEQQKLTASDGQGGGTYGDRFGTSVSAFGETILIGAHFDEDNGNSSGSAYVFVRDGVGLWREQQKFSASDGATGDSFGLSVSISGDTSVIGAYQDDDNGTDSGSSYVFVRDATRVWSEQQKLTAGDSELAIKKLINHRVRDLPDISAQLLAGSRYRVDYKVTNNSPNRVYGVQVFEGGQLVCNLYALDPGESKQRYNCASNQTVLTGNNNVPATVTAKVSGSSQELSSHTNAYYTGLSNMPGKLKVTHYVNDRNADTEGSAVDVNGNKAEVLFRVVNTGPIELYRVNTFHDPASPVNSGWQQKCFIGTLDPGQVRYCKRTVDVTQAGLNKAFGRAQGEDANVSPMGYVNASNPTYFNVVLP